MKGLSLAVLSMLALAVLISKEQLATKDYIAVTLAIGAVVLFGYPSVQSR